METSVSFEARYAPSSYPTHGPTRLRGEDPVDPLLLGGEDSNGPLCFGQCTHRIHLDDFGLSLIGSGSVFAPHSRR